MVKDDNNVTRWLKKHNVAVSEARRYVLYDQSGKRKLINHAELESLCRKYFDAFYGAARDKLLRGELVGIENGHFRLEVLDRDLNVVKPKRRGKAIKS